MEKTIISIFIFALSMCITPGPNNIMLAASGANFGYKRTIPHILGIEIGMIALFTLSALGLGVIFTFFPFLKIVLKVAASLYLLYFAARIALSKGKNTSSVKQARPLRFWQAALFQFVNPKGLIICMSAISGFTNTRLSYAATAALVIAIFAVVCIPSVSVWAGFGTVVGRLLKNGRTFRLFNIFLGALTAVSVVMIVV